MNTNVEITDITRDEILGLLTDFAKQRPGLQFCNYGDHASYNSELRSITKDLKDAKFLIHWVDHTKVPVPVLLESFRAYSGRLSLVCKNGKFALEYCAGQYFPTEYRRAVCAVCAAALWDYTRTSCMPPRMFRVNGKTSFANLDDAKAYAKGLEPAIVEIDEVYNGLHGGDWIHKHFRKLFGLGIQRRWFD